MSFTEKKLRLKLLLGVEGDSFDEDGHNAISVDGLRVSATIQFGNGQGIVPTAKIMVYGLSLSIMNRITKIHWNTEESKRNYVRLEAGEGDVWTVVYSGLITFAFPNFGSSSEAILTIDSASALEHQLLPVPPVSFKGEVDVAEAIREICQRMKMRFENNGVNAKLSNTYLCETALEQVKKLCAAANVDLYIDINTIAITPRSKPRDITIPIISPSTGLLGYPVPNINGVSFQCLYDPALKFGGLVEIADSMIEMANGRWRVFGINLFLESMTPNGRWFAEIQAAKNGEVKLAK
ncbi:baseplate hub protein [Testudinibacter sp. P80/BLE/0925]